MRHYCTLFDRGYLAKGLVLHESMLQHSSEPFTLHILAMDMETAWILDDLKLENVEVLPLQNLEKALNLGPVRMSRSWAEYCWTCGSNLMDYLMGWLNEGVTYLDSDLMFFSDPKVIFDEIGSKSLGIIPHRFPPNRKHMERNGIYNVSWVTAQHSIPGRNCIQQWARQCREWCFARNEPGRFGDQAYLDLWPHEFPGQVCPVSNLGAGLAPWNIAQYELAEEDGRVYVNGQRLVFYHYHEFAELADGTTRLTYYRLRDFDIHHVYAPYLSAYNRLRASIEEAESRRAQRKYGLKLQAERA